MGRVITWHNYTRRTHAIRVREGLTEHDKARAQQQLTDYQHTTHKHTLTIYGAATRAT